VKAAGLDGLAVQALARLAGGDPLLLVLQSQPDPDGNALRIVRAVVVPDLAGTPVGPEPSRVPEITESDRHQQGDRSGEAAQVRHARQVGAVGGEQREVADERLGPRRSRRPELPQHVLTGLAAEEPLAVVRHHHLDPPGRSLPGRGPLVAGGLLIVGVGSVSWTDSGWPLATTGRPVPPAGTKAVGRSPPCRLDRMPARSLMARRRDVAIHRPRGPPIVWAVRRSRVEEAEPLMSSKCRRSYESRQ